MSPPNISLSLSLHNSNIINALTLQFTPNACPLSLSLSTLSFSGCGKVLNDERETELNQLTTFPSISHSLTLIYYLASTASTACSISTEETLPAVPRDEEEQGAVSLLSRGRPRASLPPRFAA